MSEKKLLWGLGNELLRDDAAGIIALKRLERAAPEGWQLVECGIVPENYLASLRRGEVKLLIVIDAADMDLEPGSIRLVGIDEADDVNFSTHGLPLAFLLKPFSKTTEIWLLAVQPLDMTPGEKITPPVEKAVEAIVESLLTGSWRRLPRLHQEKRSPR